MKTVKRWLSGLVSARQDLASSTPVRHPRGRAGRRDPHTPSSLLAAAGHGLDVASGGGIETLEKRQLLFTVVVDQNSPFAIGQDANGNTIMQVDFAYAIPFLFKQLPQAVQPNDFQTDDLNSVPQATLTDLQRDGLDFHVVGGSITGVDVSPPDQPNTQYAWQVNLAPGGVMVLGLEGENLADYLPLDFLAFTVNNVNANPGFGTLADLDVELIQVTYDRLDRVAPPPGEQDFLDDITTNDPDIVGVQVAGLGVANGLNNYQPANNGNPRYFDAIRIVNNGALPVQFNMDNVVTREIIARFAQFNADRVFGARLTFAAPDGAAVNVLDLYGREMRLTLNAGIGLDSPQAIIDQDDNGVPDFNDGIGRISLTGFGATGWFSITGNVAELDAEDINGNADVAEFLLGTEDRSLDGLYDDFESAGFGFALTNDAPPGTFGLGAGGSVIIGAPFIRDNRTPGAYLSALPTDVAPPDLPLAGAGRFTNTPLQNNLGGLPGIPVIKQGLSVDSSIGTVFVHGVTMGLVDVQGAIRKLNISTLLGSVQVLGDAGSIVIGGDAGVYHVNINDQPPGDAVSNTGTRITVGRALGQLQVGARNAANLVVQGDINNANRPSLSFLNYAELETVFAFNQGQVDSEEILLRNLEQNGGGAVFGDGLFRNDLIYNAEWVGATLRGAVITGALGQANPFQGSDNADAYAFAVRSGETVTFNYRLLPPPASTEPGVTIARVVDAHGRVVASMQYPPLSPNDQQLRGGDIRFKFKATRTDTYYLVVGIDSDANNTSAAVYQVTMSGQLNTTAGLVSTGATATGQVSVQSGSMGMIRAGVGRVSDAGGIAISDATGLATTTVETAQDFLAVRGLAVNIAGNLLGILTGSDIRALDVGITGDFGGLSTGWFGITDFGNGAEQRAVGDIGGLALRVGGSIALIDGAYGFAYQVNGTPLQQAGPAAPVLISSGQSGSPGHIGAILIGQTFNGAAFTLSTSANSIIDRFIVGTNGTGVIGSFQPTLNLGAGSEIRFANFDRIVVGAPGTNPDTNLVRDINYGESVRFVDDNGTPFLIRITGGVTNANNPNASRVRVRFMPVQGSQGVVVARIEAALVAGANLEIITETNGSVAIGQLRIATDTRGGADGQPQGNEPRLSEITFGGPGEIDVLSIITDGAVGGTLNVPAAGGAGRIGQIRNNTRNGDIVSIDVASVNNVFITGNLGRTQTFGGGDTRLGEFLGIAGGLQNVVGAPIGIAVGTVGNFGPIQTPLDDTDGAASLEDIGAPFDGQLDGLIVRAGNVNTVRVDGMMGDVILQGGSIATIIANADNRRATGVFEGIIGTIYALDIQSVDVGDGIADPGDSPFAEAGIFAVDDIGRVFGGSRVKNPVINGAIIAANLVPLATESDNNNADVAQIVIGDGLGQVTLTSAIVDGAFFGAASHDAFWRSIRVTQPASIDPGDAPIARGTVNRLTLTGTSLRRSDVFGLNVNEVNITRGVFDASIVQAQNDAAQPGIVTGRIRTIKADAFVNTTRDGEPLEYHIAMIRAAGDIETVQANGRGSISDLFIDVNGSITKQVTAFNISRLILDADSNVKSLKATGDFRSIRVTAGRIESATAVNIRSSTFIVAGEIKNITASQQILATAITADGPSGSIDKVSAGTGLNGTITSSGVIGLIETKRNDINALIVTTQDDASVTAIKAARDALISLDTASDVGTITAGRNVGRRVPFGGTVDQLRIDGNLANITAGGQIYTDIIVGKSITGTLKAGRTFALPNLPGAPDRDRVSDAQIVAYGRINAVAYVGDFAGSITSYSGGIGKITITGGSLRRYMPSVTTVTPTTPVQGIFAFDGNIDSITITRGHLLGDVIAFDGSIGTISVKGDANFGDIGIDPSKVLADPSSPTGADASLGNSEGRFRLPALPTGAFGAGRDGPTIRAKYDIGTISTTGKIFEAAIQAGRNIRQITAGGVDDFGIPTATPTFVIAGDTITSVSVSTKNPTAIGGMLIGAGITSLGADNAPGGIGANADTVESGDIGSVSVKGGANGLTIVAGLNAGADGVYNTGDETSARGLSTIKSVAVSGNAAGVTVFADTLVEKVTPNLLGSVGGTGAASVAPVVLAGSGTQVPVAGGTFSINGQNAFIKLSGNGQVFFDDVSVPGQARVILVGTDSKSSLEITPDVGVTTFNNLFIVSTDDASLSTLTVGATITGALSGMYIDGTVGTVNFPTLATPTSAPTLFEVGQGVTTLNLGVLGTGNSFRFTTQFLGTANIRGDFGIFGQNPGLTRLDAVNVTQVNITGDLAGVLSVDRDASRIVVSGAVNGGGVRVGGATQQFSAASLFRARLGFRGGLTTINIAGNTTESFVLAGTDLGDDARLGGAGDNADALGNANIGTATFSGDFIRSDIAAGVVRSSTGFLNTSTDRTAAGRSTIGTVNITGQVGSAANQQSFAIASNGSLGNLNVQGAPFSGTIGNFSSVIYDNQPNFLRVSDLRVAQNAGVWTARITFSQAIDQSTLSAALAISEVRGTAANLTASDPLVEGVDYVLTYDPDTFIATIEFSDDIIRRQLTTALPGPDTPQVDGFGNPIASPGVFRFTVDADVLRGQASDQRLDGNQDNVLGDDFVGYQVVGDAGDRLTPFTANTDQATIPFYSPINLDLIMGAATDPTPDINTSFSVTGGLGDHPFQSPGLFDPSGDLDVYTFTLQAGQIFRFGGLRGPAAAGSVVFFRIDAGAPAGDGFQFLPDTGSADPTSGAGFAAHALVAGTYAIAIASTDASGTFVFPPLGPPPIIGGDIVNDAQGALGQYTFDVRISDDGDSGFAGNADPNAGSPLAAPPVPADFATPDATISVPANVGPDFVYRLRAGSDGLFGTSDDLVVGTNGLGVNSTREAGLDGAFGTGDDRVLLTSDAGDGMDIVSAPLPSEFVGVDGKFGTADDLPFIVRDGYTFVLDAGANGTFQGDGNSDDLVIGTDLYGNTVTRSAGSDRNFNTQDDVSSIGASIGDRETGFGGALRGDVDIFNLNADSRVPVNTRLRLTLRTSDLGSNLGLQEAVRTAGTFQGEITATDLRGLVQLAIFDTSAKSNITDGRLIAAPDKINYLDGVPNTVLAKDAFTSYGFDEKGDFYIEFQVPARLDNPNVSASIAVYVQGALQSNYNLEVRNLGVSATPAPTNRVQNVYIETRGGSVDWLEASRTTELAGFDASVNGFTGRFNNVAAADYILNSAANPNNLVNSVQAIFDQELGAGRVRVSMNAADFEGEDFSTIYLTSSFAPAPFFNKGNVGEVERVDPFNANPSDEGVIFAPEFNLIGLGSDQFSADLFVNSLAVAVARQVGQLVGLRPTVALGDNTPPIQVMADDSPSLLALNATDFDFLDAFQPLAGVGSANSNTQFFLGTESTGLLLRRIFGV